MATTALERLLFLQGGLCFFCKAPLPKADASIEHLQATAHGGTNHDANRVACCKTLSRAMGSMPLKDKIDLLLRRRGGFVCPNGNAARPQEPATSQSPGAMPMPASNVAELQRVVEDLRQRGKKRPGNDRKLRSTLETVCTQQKLDCSVDEILCLLVTDGTVTVDRAGKVTYRF